MHKLNPITPLGVETPRVDHIGNITIREVVDQALASISARNDRAVPLQAALGTALSLTLPEVGKSGTARDFTALWTGPDQWMITANHDNHELLATELKAAVKDTASVVELTDGWCRFDVEGAAVCDLFERLSKAPVRTMASGDVIRSTIEHIGAFLWRIGEDNIAVIAPRSSAGSLHHALTVCARSIA